MIEVRSLARKRGKRWVGGVVAVVGALVLSACGSSSADGSSSSGASDTASSNAVPAPTGTPIVIGAIGSQTGPQSSGFAPGLTVTPAWADWVNANGGINGHPVQVELADDAGDAGKAQASVKDLIDNKGIDALVVVSDGQLSAYADYAVSKKIPVVSGQANSTLWYSLDGMYTTATDITSLLNGMVLTGKIDGKATKFGWLYCVEVAACAEATPTMQAAADKAGLGFMSLGVSSTATDYTAECLKLQQEGVDFPFLSIPPAAVAKFVQDCQAQGYNPTFGVTTNIGGPALALEDFKAYGPNYAFLSSADAPVVQTFTDAMSKYAKADDWRVGTGPATWGALEMLQKTMGTVTGDVTPEAVTAALNNVKDEDLGGLLANKVTFTGKALAHGSRPCYFVFSVDDGKIQAPAGLDPQCPA